MTEKNCTKNEIEQAPCPICGGKIRAEKMSEEETDYWCTKCDAWCGSCFNDVCARAKR